MALVSDCRIRPCRDRLVTQHLCQLLTACVCLAAAASSHWRGQMPVVVAGSLLLDQDAFRRHTSPLTTASCHMQSSTAASSEVACC